MAKKNDKIYPKEGEPWTSITEEELNIKGFKYSHTEVTEDYGQIGTELVYNHPKCPNLHIVEQEKNYWWIYYVRGSIDQNGKDVVIRTALRQIKYMYQIDNMFHGFTDRWLGYI